MLIMLTAILLLVSFYSHPLWLPFVASVHAQAAPARVYIESPNGSPNFTDLTNKNTSITFAVKIGSAPSIGGFVVYIVYNATPGKAILYSPSIDYTGNVLGTSITVVNGCVDSVSAAGGICSGLDTTGANPGTAVLSLGLVESGNFSTPKDTNGLLFHVTFQIDKTVLGIGQVHLLEAQYSSAGASSGVDATTYDGYYTNQACVATPPTPCRPPSVAYQITPPMPSRDSVAVFNVTVKDNNKGASITYLHWDWSDNSQSQDQTDLSQPIQHSFRLTYTGSANCVFQLRCLVTLTAHDSDGIVWETSVVVTILHLVVDVSVGPIGLTLSPGTSANPISQIMPGTPVYISANIRNLGTVPETAKMTISTEFSLLNSSFFSLASQGVVNASATMNAVWNTTGLTPRVYSIFVTISDLATPGCATGKLCLMGNVNATYLHENDPSSTLSKTVYVLMLSPQVSGGFSLSLLQTTGLGILVLVGVGAGLARFMKRPSYETEPI
jgi:hypothetical protein